jgi:uncharacterized membrane protein YphA (DoxX/SURF4 family)
MFISAGFGHAFNADKMKQSPGMQWIGAIPKPLFTAIGLLEIAGGLGAVLPMLAGILPWLTPLAAALLAVVMALAFIFHLARREYRNLSVNTFLFLLSVFVAYERWALMPF